MIFDEALSKYGKVYTIDLLGVGKTEKPKESSIVNCSNGSEKIKWNHAIIMGTSDGLGKALMYRLTSMRENLTIIDRNKFALKQIKDFLVKHYNANIFTVELDLGHPLTPSRLRLIKL